MAAKGELNDLNLRKVVHCMFVFVFVTCKFTNFKQDLYRSSVWAIIKCFMHMGML